MAKKKTSTALAKKSKSNAPRASTGIKKRKTSPRRRRSVAMAKPTSTPSSEMSRRSSTRLSTLPDLPTVGTSNLAALGLSRAHFTPTQKAVLMEDWSSDDVSIRPDGIVYVDGQKHRDRLTTAFGPGGWGELALEDLPRVDAGLIVQLWALLIGGVAITSCLGECQWASNNPMMSKGDAVEGAKTNALTRNLKGVVNQNWRNKRWAYQFRLKHGVLVQWRRGTGWRHIDDPPLDKEQGIDDRSPNRERYRSPGVVEQEAGHTRPGARESATDQQQEASQAIVVTSEEPINNQAKGQIAQAMETHQRSQTEVQAFLFAQYGIKSRTQIKKKDLADVLSWIRAPYDADTKTRQERALGLKEGEVV